MSSLAITYLTWVVVISSMIRCVLMNAAVNNLLDKDFTEYMDNYDLNGDVQQAYKYLSIGSAMSGTYISGRNYWLSISYDF